MFFSKSFLFKGDPNQKKAFRLDPFEFARGIKKKNVQLIDVRTPSEYNQGKIKGSINLNFYSRDFYQRAISSLDKQSELYLYCRSGARSRRAAKKLAKLGFESVYDLKGGISAWSRTFSNTI